ncbi:RecT family recombinase [Peribacillus sp. NPDC056705]|uniref:RecT family recombinase n=1 Tax=Peribacillus sp. NPDC056705 TaxID=3345918 RepID=UPI003749BD89
MKNQLAFYQSLVFGELTEQDVVTIRETIGKDCNESQFKLFMSISKSADANPVLNEIYPAVRGGQLTVQFGIDFYVRKAKETPGYLGYDVQLVHENDEFKMHQEMDEDGRYFIVIDEHSFGFPRGKVIGGYTFAYKEGLKPFSVIMEVEEVEHYKKSNIGMQKTMWTNNFNDMFKKHMVRRALKAAFGLNFDDGSVENRDSDVISEYKQNERKDITPSPEVIDKPKNDETDAIDEAKTELNAKFRRLGITGKQAKSDYIKTNAPDIKGDPTLSQLLGLLELMEMHIDMQGAQLSDDDELE